MLAKTIGTDVPTAMDLAEKKSIDANSAISGMLSQMSTKYGGMMQKQSNTITGILSNIQDKASNTMRQVGEDIVAAFDLKTATNNALDTLTEFSGKVKSLGIGGAMVDMVPASVEIGLLATAGAMTAKMIPALYEMAIAETAVGLALGPLMGIGALVAAALGTVVYQSMQAKTETDALTISLYAGADGMAAVSLYASDAAGNLNGVGNAANYATTAMANFNKTAQEHRSPGEGYETPVVPTPPVIPEIPSGGGGGSSGVDEAAKAYEDLQEKAKQASESIEGEWIQLTNTQLEQLDKWKADELKTLDESQSANENYQRDLTRLDEIYAEKKKKILADQQKETNSIWDKALSDATDYQNRLAEIGMGDGTKQVFEIKSNAAEELTKIQNAARDTEQAFEQLSNESKLQSIQVMTEAKTAFTVSKNGMVVDAKDLATQVKAGAADMSNTQISLAQDVANKTVLVNQEMAEKLKTVHQEIADFEGNLSKARNDGNLSALVTELNSGRLALAQDLAGRQEMFDVYYDALKETHRTSMSYMAELTSGIGSSFKDFFSDAISGASSVSDAWSDLGQSINKVISNMVAEWIAAQIQMAAMNLFSSVFGISLFSNGGSVSGSGTLSSMIGGFASGGYTGSFGSRTKDHIPAVLAAGEYVLNSGIVSAIGVDKLDALNSGNLSGFATGGLVTGPSLSSLSSRYTSSAIKSNATANTASDSKTQTAVQPQITLHAWDGKSVDKWLSNGGAKKIAKALNSAMGNGYETVF
ncbi:MAG: putative tail length tape measure protein [Firmicutes bacterium]|nr:putative tail length tape measure protein [Bacillota bacterium]